MIALADPEAATQPLVSATFCGKMWCRSAQLPISNDCRLSQAPPLQDTYASLKSEYVYVYNMSLEELSEHLELPLKGWTNALLVREAANRGLSVARHDEKRMFYFEDGNGRRFAWRNGYTTWNTRLSQRVAQHKDVCSRILTAYGVPATENQVFDHGDAGRAWLWAESLGTLVVKPVDGLKGRNVHVGINDRDEFLDAFYDVAKHHKGRVLVEKFYSGVEHRCFVVNGRMVGAIRRRPANVLGDGISTIAALIDEKNQDRGPIHLRLPVDATTTRVLATVGRNLDSVPSRGERVYVRKASNIHQGGDAIDATDDLSSEEISIAEAAARAIPGCRSVGLDLLVPRNPGETDIRVLELNTNPMVSMHHFPLEGKPRDVAGAIIDGMFPKTRK